MRIAVDAMGGDRAPDAIVAGVLDALSADASIEIDLVGPVSAVDAALDAAAPSSELRDRVALIPAEEIPRTEESPVHRIRFGHDSPIRTCIRRLRRGDADAMVSAGDTGAIVAAAVLRLGRIEGVARPGIAVRLPTASGGTILIDAGANPSPRPLHLLHYAAMGAELARATGVATPRVGVLSVGTEKGKGTRLIRRVDGELNSHASSTSFEYVGLVEGQDLFGDTVDVVVSDGLTGNAVLKACEGLAHRIAAGSAGGHASSDLDFAATGGAPLLGVRGIVIIGHGRSDARAIANAILAARDVARHGLVERIATVVRDGRDLSR